MKRTFSPRCGVLLLIVVASLPIYLVLFNEHHITGSSIRDGISNKIYRKEILDERFKRHEKSGTGILELLSWKSFRNITSIGVKMIDAEYFRQNLNAKMGNPLIDNYNETALSLTDHGEYGRPVSSSWVNGTLLKKYEEIYKINVLLSDIIPLNRHVPDSRTMGCSSLHYEHDLPTASIIIPFYDEWYSILLRTVYSIINRTPRHLLQEIILIDDNSSMVELKKKLDDEIRVSFPTGLVKIIRNQKRLGLIRCRLEGWKQAKGDVLVFFDSHMEVNIDWLQPLLTEIKKDKRTIAMSVLDYIDRLSFQYNFNKGYLIRYGFDWSMLFFETFFLPGQIGKDKRNARVGAIMVGAAYAVDKSYFEEIGSYDEGMNVWGAENLEMSWRVWLCGGKLVHLPCSHIGHIVRRQPYSFPGGRSQIEMRNYKRAIEVWMDEPMKKFVYDFYSEMTNVDAGDLSERMNLKKRLGCKNFTWFIDNVWPELTVFDRHALAWGSVINMEHNVCLDTHNYLFTYPEKLYTFGCHYYYKTQGGQLIHIASNLCLSVDKKYALVMERCDIGSKAQNWTFTHYV